MKRRRTTREPYDSNHPLAAIVRAATKTQLAASFRCRDSFQSMPQCATELADYESTPRRECTLAPWTFLQFGIARRPRVPALRAQTLGDDRKPGGVGQVQLGRTRYPR
jgi:hypothetical protein